MKVTLPVIQLQEITDLLMRFVSKHATLPVLENVYIKAWLDWLLFRATDMEKYLEVTLNASPDDEGAITVNAKALSDLLRTIEEDQLVLSIDMVKDNLTITSAKDEFVIKWIAATEFVAVPSVKSDRELTLDISSFTKWISKVEYAVMEKNFSPVLTWVMMRTKQYEDWRKLVFVWTDSFRLAEYKISQVIPFTAPYTIIIPKVHVQDLKRVAEYASSKWASTMKLIFSDNMVSCQFSLEGVEMQCTALLIQWSFPEYENENIMPTSSNATVIVDKLAFDKALRKIAILTRDLNNYVYVSSNETNLQLTSWETDLWKGETSLPAAVDGPMTWFGANAKYIADFLKAAESNEIMLRFIWSDKPIILKDQDDTSFTYVVRPLIK
jgi:DNA polymerase III subunit beta